MWRELQGAPLFGNGITETVTKGVDQTERLVHGSRVRIKRHRLVRVAQRVGIALIFGQQQ